MDRARREILAAFDDMHVDGQTLRQFIAHAQLERPDLLIAHRADEVCPEIDSNTLHWNPRYYSTQKRFAEFNFSRRRLDHLIEVREYFRGRQYRGFTPCEPVHRASDISMNVQSELSESSAPYQPSANLRKFVDGGELSTARSALGFELNDNRLSGQHMLDALAWAMERLPGLCEPYGEKAFAGPLDADSSHWTPDYYDRQTVYLKTNFAADRYRHLVQVRMFLRERNTPGFVPTDDVIDDTTLTAAPVVSVASSNVPPPTQRQRESQTSGSRTQQQQPPHRVSRSLLKIALIVGGALAAALILLTLTR